MRLVWSGYGRVACGDSASGVWSYRLMIDYVISPSTGGTYDVLINEPDGRTRSVLGLATIVAALDWIADQRKLARQYGRPHDKL
jgi:hypothetical protein